MTKKSEIIGQKFNRLTCVEFVGKNKHNQSIFRFLCNCGNFLETLGTSVKQGVTKSCGCYVKEINSSRRIDLTGQKFGRLTCIEFCGRTKGQSLYKFSCECGNVTKCLYSSVKYGETKSCGCYRKEKSSISGSLVGNNNGKSNRLGWIYGSTRMRSGYEIFYATILDENRIDWEYEPEIFKLDNGIRYIPDFYLPESDTWIEIKGRMTYQNVSKIERFRRLNGGNKLKVYFLKDLEKLAGQSYQSFMKENKEYFI